jgi:hypothetical protein
VTYSKAVKRPVKLPLKLQTAVLVLCVFTLFLAQAFGIERGFTCKCTGIKILTQTSHCHGPHGQQCHSLGDRRDCSHSDEAEGNREEHDSVNVELLMRATQEAQPIIAPTVLLALLPRFEIVTPEMKVCSVGLVVEAGRPPFTVTAARSVILLI